MGTTACPICLVPTDTDVLEDAKQYSFWRRQSGACPACVQDFLLQTLLDEGHAAFHERVQTAWPLDAEAAFGALPTPLRLHADPRFTGRGVVMAIVDSGFYPHPDIIHPTNRVRAWVDAGSDPASAISFGPYELPRWPGWDEARDFQWHGLMTSVAAAGNGLLSHGLYRGLASEAELILIQVRDPNGKITDGSIRRALDWIDCHPEFGVSVVNLSVSGDPGGVNGSNPVDDAVTSLVEKGLIVVAAAGNDGVRHLVPPATCRLALTVGGIDDKNTFDHDQMSLWHGNYGSAADGSLKPEVVAPSMWVAAPILPGTGVAREAGELLRRRSADDERRIAEMKLINPHYQHADGTSFAAPLVASAVACMMEAGSMLSPMTVRELLRMSSCPVQGVAAERQGAGVIDAGRAVALALQERHDHHFESPRVRPDGITFTLHEHVSSRVDVLGSWDGWSQPGLAADPVDDGLWIARSRPLPPGRHTYKFLLDGTRWLDDPANPVKVPDGVGGLNSVITVRGDLNTA